MTPPQHRSILLHSSASESRQLQCAPACCIHNMCRPCDCSSLSHVRPDCMLCTSALHLLRLLGNCHSSCWPHCGPQPLASGAWLCSHSPTTPPALNPRLLLLHDRRISSSTPKLTKRNPPKMQKHDRPRQVKTPQNACLRGRPTQCVHHPRWSVDQHPTRSVDFHLEPKWLRSVCCKCVCVCLVRLLVCVVLLLL